MRKRQHRRGSADCCDKDRLALEPTKAKPANLIPTRSLTRPRSGARLVDRKFDPPAKLCRQLKAKALVLLLVPSRRLLELDECFVEDPKWLHAP